MAWTPEPFAAGRLRSSELWVPILASGLIMGLALGARHVQGLFLLPVTADRVWSRETFALAMAAQT
jgi:NO-binding membrane sensor protein with MHYT domain